MPITNKIYNETTRQTYTFHKITGLTIDRVSGLMKILISSWLDEKDYNENPSSPIKSIDTILGENQIDYIDELVENDDSQIKKEYEKGLEEGQIPKDISFEKFKFHINFPDKVSVKKEYRYRNYKLDQSKSIDETYQDIYKIISNFPEFQN